MIMIIPSYNNPGEQKTNTWIKIMKLDAPPPIIKINPIKVLID